MGDGRRGAWRTVWRTVWPVAFLAAVLPLRAAGAEVLRWCAADPPRCREVHLIPPAGSAPRRVVWVLPGYSPPGDPYRQQPAEVARRWNLPGLAAETGALFVLPSPDHLLPRLAAGPGGDRIWFRSLRGEISRRHPGLPEEGVGISSGAESLLAWALAEGGFGRLLLLSGTYDYGLLDPAGGEHRIHRRSFGEDPAAWRGEEPVTIIRSLGADAARTTPALWVAAEERSACQGQAGRLLEVAAAGGLRVRDLRPLGRGLGHDWGFWASPAVRLLLARVAGGAAD